MSNCKWPRLCLFLLALVFSPGSRAVSAETPLELTGAIIVSAEQVQRLLVAGALLVDTRVGNEYAESHIRGAINIPYKETSPKAANFDPALDHFQLSKLPAEKSRPIIFYCNSGDCWKSYKASAVSIKAGYTRVHWFRGGFPEWKKKGLPIE